MKIKALFFLLSISLGLLLYGCESSTDTKAETVTRPVLKEPTDNATNVSLTPTFKWDNTGNRIEIDINSSFASPQFVKSDLNGIECTWSWPNQLDPNKDYYWRVGVNSGGTIYWSESIFHFRTLQ